MSYYYMYTEIGDNGDNWRVNPSRVSKFACWIKCQTVKSFILIKTIRFVPRR